MILQVGESEPNFNYPRGSSPSGGGQECRPLRWLIPMRSIALPFMIGFPGSMGQLCELKESFVIGKVRGDSLREDIQIQ